MSIVKTKPTPYHDTDQAVRFRIDGFSVRNITNKEEVEIDTHLLGKIDGTVKPLDGCGARITWQDIQAEFTPSEKGAAKTLMKALERVTGLKVAELAGEPQDDTDVFA